MTPDLAAAAAASYLLGSIPTAVIVARALRGIDIREHGSGNPGASNTLRVLGWPAAIGVGLFDIAKGVVAVLFCSQLHVGGTPPDPLAAQVIAGLAAVSGHIWTVFAGFRGGKGVATAAGAMAALAPKALLMCLPVFIAVAWATRYAAVASLSGAALFPIILLLLRRLGWSDAPDPVVAFGAALFVLFLFTHRANIMRLIAGTENRFGEKG